MSRTLAMRYGSANELPANGLEYFGVLNDDDGVEMALEEGGIYMLYTSELNPNTGVVKGYRIHYILSPAGETFGTVAADHKAIVTSTNSYVTITYETDGTITLARANANTEVKYALQKIA